MIRLALTLSILSAIGFCQDPKPVSPILAFSSTFGTLVQFTAFDRTGNIYITGTAYQIPLVNALKRTPGSGNCSAFPGKTFVSCPSLFLAKFDPTGTRLLYSTYLGPGNGRDTAGGLAVDNDGNALVPVIASGAGPFFREPFGMVTVYKVNATGSALVYYRSLGGTIKAAGIAVDSQGNAYVTGTALGDGFPSVNALQPAPVVSPIYSTSDGGTTWRPLDNGLPAKEVFSMAVDPARPSTLYIATDIGVFKSLNAGASWTRLLPDATIARQIVIAANSTIYVTYGPSNEYLARSADAGSTWTTVSDSLPESSSERQAISAFAVDPANPANLWLAGRGFDKQTLYKSDDGGKQWTPVLTGSSFNIFVTPEFNGILIAGSNIAVCCRLQGGAMYISSNGGGTWPEGGENPPNGSAAGQPLVDPFNPQTIYASHGSGVIRSTDFGRTWEILPLPAGSPSNVYRAGSLAIDPASGTLSLVSERGLLLRSSDRGKTWKTSRGPWGERAKILALDPVQPQSTMYVGSLTHFLADDYTRKAFVAKLNPAGALEWATLLGGSKSEDATAIAVDREGNPVVAGTTFSEDFPLASPLQKTKGQASDAFLTKLSSAGDRLIFSTFLGGDRDDRPTALDFDAGGNVYVTGYTSSRDFPIVNGLQPRPGGQMPTGFVAKLDPGGARLIFSTFLGGIYDDSPASLVVDSGGAMWIAGTTHSPDFPLVRPLQPSTSTMFLTRIAPSGAALDFSTYLGSLFDSMSGVKLDQQGNPWVFGNTYLPRSIFFGSAPGEPGNQRGFFAKLSLAPAPPATPGKPFIQAMYNAASYHMEDAVSPGTIGTLIGAELAPVSQAATSTPLPRELGGVSVTIGGIAAPLYYVSPGQINYQAPVELPLGQAELVVKRGTAVSETRLVRVLNATPAIFTANGAPIVVHASDYGLVTEQNPARIGEYLAVFCTGLGLTEPRAKSGELNPPVPAPLVEVLGYVVIDSRIQSTSYAGLAPGFAGLYQINFQLDTVDTPGKRWLYVFDSNRVPIWVR